MWHIVPLGDVGQHTFPWSVPGRPCRRSPELDPGRGQGMGAISHLGGAGSERGGGHTPSSVVRWATSQLAPSEGVRYVSGCHALKTPSMGRGGCAGSAVGRLQALHMQAVPLVASLAHYVIIIIIIIVLRARGVAFVNTKPFLHLVLSYGEIARKWQFRMSIKGNVYCYLTLEFT